MERKIGEIFEYNGEWYQCLEEKTCTCFECDFHDYNCDDISLKKVKGSCQSEYRKDNKSVIFKKLEKVGEPFTSVGKLYQHYKVFEIDNVCGNGFWCVHNYKAKTLTIEIKQNKEDMEEKKQKLDKLVDDYMACRIQYTEFDKEIKALYDKEESESTLKEFDLEAAKAGKPVCTRDGRKVRIVCFDRKFLYEGQDYCIVALINEGCYNEAIYSYTNDGLYTPGKISNNDLMMLSEKKEGWINIYDADTTFRYVDGRVYETKDEAVQKAKEEIAKELREKNEYIDTIRVEWEE